MDEMPASGTRRKQSFSCLRVFLAVFVIVGVTTVVGVILILPDLYPSLGKIEKTCSLKFPPSAKLAKSYGRIFLEYHVLAKVEMDKADVEEFVDSLPRPREMSETEMLDMDRISPGMDWWDLRSARRYKAIKFEKRAPWDTKSWRNRGWNILIKLDNPDKAIVYLQYWSFTSD